MLKTVDDACQNTSPFWFDYWLDDDMQAQFRSLLWRHARHLDAAQILTHESDETGAIFIVLEGWVALSKSLPEGQTQVIDFGLSGDIFDVTSADGVTAAIGFEAVTYAQVAVVPFHEWAEFVRTRPQIAVITQKTAAATRARISERMLRLGRGSAEERLAYAFLELGVRIHAQNGTNLDCFHLPITQQKLGDFMRLTSVHVCRTLRRLVRQEVIRMSDHIFICILDPAALVELAGIFSDALAREILPVS